MRQLIIDDYNGLLGLIDYVEKAALERDDIHFRVVNTDTDNTQKQMESKQNTIRNLRRENRHLKSLLKSKDRLLDAQKSLYEEMIRFNESKAKTDEKKIESTVVGYLKRILIDGVNTN
ncbi:MAG: hypothetical protein IKP73_07805 [Bacteroidales bacterium]|nr:hypothetical protein [Bacteroidales bacterium]